MLCDKCDGIARSNGDESVTLVGVMTNFKTGHKHDDNCRKRYYVCDKDPLHIQQISIRRRCEIPGCDWLGKETCFCHPGNKVDEWPE